MIGMVCNTKGVLNWRREFENWEKKIDYFSSWKFEMFEMIMKR